MSEYLDVLDMHGLKTGVSKQREQIHNDGDWHLTVHLWIINEYGDLFLQKRADGFWLGNGMLDATCVGHVQANDSVILSVIREAQEELGINLTEDGIEFLVRDSFSLIGSTRFIPRYINNEFHDVFVSKTSVNLFDFKFDSGEMSGLELVTQEEFKKMVQDRDTRLVPQWKEYEVLLWYLGGQ